LKRNRRKLGRCHVQKGGTGKGPWLLMTRKGSTRQKGGPVDKKNFLRLLQGKSGDTKRVQQKGEEGGGKSVTAQGRTIVGKTQTTTLTFQGHGTQQKWGGKEEGGKK